MACLHSVDHHHSITRVIILGRFWWILVDFDRLSALQVFKGNSCNGSKCSVRGALVWSSRGEPWTEGARTCALDAGEAVVKWS